MMEAIRSSKTSVLIGATRRHISEDGILHSHRRENLKSYIFGIIMRRRIRWGGGMQHSLEQTGIHAVFWWENQVIRKPGIRRKDNIQMDLSGAGWNVMDWDHLAQDKDKWQPLSGPIKCWAVTEWSSDCWLLTDSLSWS
jgi:hypothetical protein